jgi:lipoprotein-anchoring transpeptidase ErfK/SrfK
MQSFARKIRVEVSAQRLDLLEAATGSQEFHVLVSFPVSTSGFGLGSEPGSFKTPVGRFAVAEMIGHGAPEGSVFKGRVPTGEVGSNQSPDDPNDLVQTRILWLQGLEPHNANTRQRYIYIHGTNHEERIGQPCSHGCVRMRNADVRRLFELVQPGVEVVIDSGGEETSGRHPQINAD